MIIGVPKEVKDHESRVGVTPAGVKALVEAGHKVLVEQKAGALSAMPDDEYQAAGAEIVGSAHDVWRLAEMVVKVKEPVEKEYKHFREGLVLFTSPRSPNSPTPFSPQRSQASPTRPSATEPTPSRCLPL